MPKRNGSLGDIVVLLPWWVSVTLALMVYIGLTFVIPQIGGDDPVIAPLTNAGKLLAPFVALFFLFLAGLSAFRAGRSSRLVDEQRSLDSLREVPWKRFEDLVAELYRRQGYWVEESFSGGADGGIDLVLRKDGNKFLVQCKRWKHKAVGAPIVRELYGLMVAEESNAAKLVTTSTFTKEAVAFAAGKPLELVDGDALLKSIQDVQKEDQPATFRHAVSDGEAAPAVPEPPVCPKCGESMVLRTTRRGEKKGQKFWGCIGYPKCRETMDLTYPPQ